MHMRNMDDDTTNNSGINEESRNRKDCKGKICQRKGSFVRSHVEKDVPSQCQRQENDLSAFIAIKADEYDAE